MLKNNGKKAAVAVVSTACLCLLLLLVAVQHHRVQVEQETDGQDIVTRSLLQDAAQEEEADAQPESTEVQKGFSAYFTKLTRGRRDVEKPARSSASATDMPPAEDISAGDIFIAVKTTKKFHQSRLNLLLDTWISRNMQQVKGSARLMHACICTLYNTPHGQAENVDIASDLLVCELQNLCC